jgi:hypothetical protein
VGVALTHRHIPGIGFDLPAVRPIFTEYVESFRLDDRLDVVDGDFLEAPLPRADVISFGHVCHGENQRTRQQLVAKAYAATPPGGAVIVYDAMIQPGRRDNFQSMLSSLNIMLESREGYESSTGACANYFAPVFRQGQGAPPDRSHLGGVRIRTRPAAVGRLTRRIVRARRGRVPRSGSGPESPPEKPRPCRRRSSRCGPL